MASAAGHSEAFSQLLMAALKITTLGDSPRSAACRKKKTQRLGEIKRDLYVVLYIYISIKITRKWYCIFKKILYYIYDNMSMDICLMDIFYDGWGCMVIFQQT